MGSRKRGLLCNSRSYCSLDSKAIILCTTVDPLCLDKQETIPDLLVSKLDNALIVEICRES